jgi:hypothetical protein
MTAISIERSTSKTERRPSYGFVRSMPVEGDAATAAVLCILRAAFAGKPATVARVLASDHSEVYHRMMLNGDKPLPLHLFARLLLALPADTARQALQAMGDPLGLDVTFRASSSVKDAKSEALDVAAAFGVTMERFRVAIADGRVTADEVADIEAAARKTQAEIDELLRSIHQ